MQYTTLGGTGLQVSRICLGSATWGVVPLAEDIPAMINTCLDIGINFIESASSYGNQARFDRPTAPPLEKRLSAEELMGKAIKGHRDEFILATKVQEPVAPFGLNDRGASRVHIMRQVEESLRRLQTDHIDIYYLHHADPLSTSLDVVVRTFDDLIKQGKIRYWAASAHTAWRLVDLLWAADRCGVEAPVAHELRYNLDGRDPEMDVLPATLKYGLGVTVFGPLAGGLLAGMTAATREYTGQARWGGSGFNERQLSLAKSLDALADEWGHPSAQLALAWLLSRPGITSAIVGAETPDELRVNAAAADLDLGAEKIAQIDALNPQRARFM